MLRTIDKELVLYFFAFIIGIVCFLLIKPMLDKHFYDLKNRHYGYMEKTSTRASEGYFLDWAEVRENEFLSKVGFEILVAWKRNQDTQSLEKCLQELVGGSFVDVIVPVTMEETEVEEKVAVCTAILNYHPADYEINYRKWVFLD